MNSYVEITMVGKKNGDNMIISVNKAYTSHIYQPTHYLSTDCLKLKILVDLGYRLKLWQCIEASWLSNGTSVWHHYRVYVCCYRIP